MSAEIKKEIELEIAHVLFVDIVGYSKLSINEQNAAVDELTKIVRSTEQFQKADVADRLIKIPSGDGMALVFYTSPEAPVRCAVEISRALKEHPRLKIRMGVHSGPVKGVIDVAGRTNLTGAGLNLAQRVMECGYAGHILLSKHVAEDLSEFEEWRPLLHDLGTCEVKHGVQVAVVNLWSDEVGNRQLPQTFQALRKKRARVRWAEVAAALVLLAGIVAAFVLVSRKPALPTAIAPEKSIAVLPFENLSRDPDNAYFAVGIQDEILTRLAKIGALKVISHASTQQYPARPGNLPEIARQLGVANILEGSVQKVADLVHINVQLIHAATDEHLWAESYDRKVEKIFDVEAEVATSVAEALKAKLTGATQHKLEEKPTNNPEAYDAYLRGLAYSLRPGSYPEDNRAAIKHFGEAVKLDPKFALAWAWFARENAQGYFNRIENDFPALRDAAKRAANKAIELRPDLGEVYLAQGYSQYYGEQDYDSAVASFEKAAALSPNNSEIPRALGRVYRRKGQWQRSLDYLRQAAELDPRNTSLLQELAYILSTTRQYSAALKIYDQILDIIPGNSDALAGKIGIYQAQGNLAAAAALLSPLPPPHLDRGNWPYLLDVQIDQWTYERRYADAITALKTALAKLDGDKAKAVPLSPPETISSIALEWHLAWFQQFSGDIAAAHVTWQRVLVDAEAARRIIEKENFTTWPLASAYVALGDEAKAFSTLEYDAALPSSAKDAVVKTSFPLSIAQIAVQAGKKDLALEQLAISARNPVGVEFGDLKFNPLWDPLRNDPRFEKIVTSLTPKL
jgi:TolB-like protein/class 3 adenylate cyclase/Flp pilus assembly protein TadD